MSSKRGMILTGTLFLAILFSDCSRYWSPERMATQEKKPKRCKRVGLIVSPKDRNAAQFAVTGKALCAGNEPVLVGE